MSKCLRLLVITLAAFATVPSLAYAQASFTGVVRDTSGAVLPGVTVEASSPALIEKVRSAVTDGTGRYRIENLRPGVYTITFTLPGFATVRREGIELSGTFSATTNAELRVGALEETITVSGEAPVVDVQSTGRETVLDQEAIDALPTSRVTNVLIRSLPNVTTDRQDVGGINGDGVARGSAMVRGNVDARAVTGGVGLHGASGMQGATSTVSNIAAYSEVTVNTGGTSAEQVEGGVIINLIPKDGGNTFSGNLFANFANGAMQGNNFTQELKDAGLSTPNRLDHLSEFNPSFGGPIKRDRVWFFWTMRHMIANAEVPVFFNKNAGNPNVWTYEPDLERPPAQNQNTLWDFSNIRTTWQVNPKHKVAVTFDSSDACDCPRSLTASLAPEAVAGSYQKVTRKMTIAQWTAPVTNRLLLEATVYGQWKTTPRTRENPYLPGANVRWTGAPGIPGQAPMIAAMEQSTGITYRGTANAQETGDDVMMGAVTTSYVTGAHSLKAGFTYRVGRLDRHEFSPDSPLLYRFNLGVPNRITLRALERHLVTNVDADNGLFVQDKWTKGRLTLTGGVRFDFFYISYPASSVGPTLLAPNRNVSFPEADALHWNDVSPRSGLAYDLFGDGKTALKVSLNKYLIGTNIGSGDLTVVTTDVAPAARLVSNTTRSWNDANRNIVPDCNLTNPAANGECGAMANQNFGSTAPGITIDPDILKGWGKRPYNWQFSVGVQRELASRVSLDVGYWRSWWGKFFITDNRAVGPADFDPYSITAPVDPRLPGGGGYVVSGLYDIKPNRFGQADDFFTTSDKYGDQTDLWTGVDVTINARPRAGVFLQGGTNTQRQTTDNCDVVAKVDNPSPLYCHVTGKFVTQLKLLGSYTVPRIDLQLSASFQNLPGPEILANYVVVDAAVSPSLGRSLAGGARNVEVNIVEPRSLYGERWNRLDLKIAKVLRWGRTSVSPSLDLYNVMNSSGVIVSNNSFASWQRPQEILTARFAKVGIVLTF